jgi:hypothetical protein
MSMQIAEILKLTPRKRQTMLFSATMTEEVKRLASLSLQRPVRLAADPTAQAPRELVQEIIRLKVRLGHIYSGWYRLSYNVFLHGRASYSTPLRHFRLLRSSTSR